MVDNYIKVVVETENGNIFEGFVINPILGETAIVYQNPSQNSKILVYTEDGLEHFNYVAANRYYLNATVIKMFK